MSVSFIDFIASGKRIIFDGAMGTMLQQRGLGAGESPEEFCLAHPDILEGVHTDYAKAGADVLTTNTFGGTRFKLPSHIEVVEFNRLMALAAKRAASKVNRQIYIAGSIGPTGKFLRPLGDLSFEQLVSVFQEQVRGLIEGGVDLIIGETHFDITEAKALVIATRRESSLPVAVSMTYEEASTLTGSGADVCVATLANMGISLIGMNCSAGPKEMQQAASVLLSESPIPVLIQPNAGIPELVDGETLFPLAPEEFSALTAEFAARGAQAVGGCCGTTPDHIAALRKKVDKLPAVTPRPQQNGIVVTSRSHLVRIGRGYPTCLIGERINPTGKKELTKQFQAGEFDEAMRFAEEQIARGSRVLDVNTGAPMVNEVTLLPELVAKLTSQFNIPLSIDSSNKDAIAAALLEYPASPLINSISGEKGRMEALGPLCKEFGAPFVLLPLKGSTLPVTAKDRIRILEKLLQQMDDMGIPRRLAIVDILVLSASSSPRAAEECLDVIRYCETELQLPTTCGLSNISFGLPARDLLNTTFFTLGMSAGLSSCIANPSSTRLIEALDAGNVLFSHDEGAEYFINNYAGWKSGGNQGGASSNGGSVAGSKPAAELTLEEALILGRKELMEGLVNEALESGEIPFEIVGERLIPSITEVGNKYERKEYFLPQLIRSAEAMKVAFGILEPLLRKDSNAEQRPVIILATVEGDIHDIGKNIVGLMLSNYGFEVKDLGKDVAAKAIIDAVKEHNASLVGLSALMTTTMVRMEDTVALLEKEGMSQKVMVGGAVVTDAFAKSIGAYYSPDAVDAVRLAKELLSS